MFSPGGLQRGESLRQFLGCFVGVFACDPSGGHVPSIDKCFSSAAAQGTAQISGGAVGIPVGGGPPALTVVVVELIGCAEPDDRTRSLAVVGPASPSAWGRRFCNRTRAVFDGRCGLGGCPTSTPSAGHVQDLPTEM